MTPRATRWPLRAGDGDPGRGAAPRRLRRLRRRCPRRPAGPVRRAGRSGTEQAGSSRRGAAGAGSRKRPAPVPTCGSPVSRSTRRASTSGCSAAPRRNSCWRARSASRCRARRSPPTASRVAYVRFDQAPAAAGDIGSDIHILDLGAGIDVPVRSHGRAGEFFWSPQWLDDGRLVYSHQVNAATGDGAAYRIDIELIDLNSGSVELLRADATDPGLSPDAAMLAFVDHPASDHILAVAGLGDGRAATGAGPRPARYVRQPRLLPAAALLARRRLDRVPGLRRRPAGGVAAGGLPRGAAGARCRSRRPATASRTCGASGPTAAASPA